MGWDILTNFGDFEPSYWYLFWIWRLEGRRIKISKAPRVISEIYFVTYISLHHTQGKAASAAEGTWLIPLSNYLISSFGSYRKPKWCDFPFVFQIQSRCLCSFIRYLFIRSDNQCLFVFKAFSLVAPHPWVRHHVGSLSLSSRWSVTGCATKFIAFYASVTPSPPATDIDWEGNRFLGL